MTTDVGPELVTVAVTTRDGLTEVFGGTTSRRTTFGHRVDAGRATRSGIDTETFPGGSLWPPVPLPTFGVETFTYGRNKVLDFRHHSCLILIPHLNISYTVFTTCNEVSLNVQ